MKFLPIHIFIQLFLLLVLFGCSKEAGISPTAPTGKGGSMARFAINGNYLYTVDMQNLRTFDISNPAQPIYKTRKSLGFDIETLFPFDKYLLVGTQTGMQVVSIQNPENPQWLSTYTHIRTCDPVVAQDSIAYVTLRAGTTCGTANVNQLEIINIKNPSAPQLLKTYPLTNPYGLAVDGNKLFVCDGNAGLRVFRMDTPTTLTQTALYSYAVKAYDVIPYNNNLIMSAEDGIYQYAYSQANNDISYLSKISVER